MMNNAWSGPSLSAQSTDSGKNMKKMIERNSASYRCLVVDSGPIIKETNVAQWRDRADKFLTVPAVIAEIRDAKARHKLQQLWIPILGLEVKEPSAEGMQHVIDFSKLTGDYPSLSSVDLQVLALAVDLEKEGCLSLGHLRTTPKRMVGLGPISDLSTNPNEMHEEEKKNDLDDNDNDISEKRVDNNRNSCDHDDDAAKEDAIRNGATEDESITSLKVVGRPSSIPPTSTWGKRIISSNESNNDGKNSGNDNATENSSNPLSQVEGKLTTMNISEASDPLRHANDDDNIDNGKVENSAFPTLEEAVAVATEASSDVATISMVSSRPDPIDSKKNELSATVPTIRENSTNKVSFQVASEEEIQEQLRREEEERQRLKEEALKPISKSGKLYNSFGKYKKLMQPSTKSKKKKDTAIVNHDDKPAITLEQDTSEEILPTFGQSRILGGMSGAAMTTVAADDMKAEDDDGEGWITSSTDIRALKNQSGGGVIDPIKGSTILPEDSVATANAGAIVGPSNDQRTACTTTDFAMQNVLLQMGMILLSIDGMQIRRLKSWVLRCGACFKIHTDPVDPKTGMRRMFCAHCGSDMVQRVSASVDGKNGRLKLHFSKKKQNKHTSARGTKFSLPKAGSNNRFQGDLLLREDQLLTGAWNQKVRKNGGGQSRAPTESIFGKDLASNVGCGVTSMPNDIQVGFGRRNPNTAKGRERRGKKKKSSDRACGLRRY